MQTHYDLIAIGAGSGGLSVAEKAAAFGKRCAIIEKDTVLGGTCVNRGCVPKKVMWYGAEMAQAIRNASGYGFKVEQKGFDWKALVDKRENYIQGINSWYQSWFKDLNIDLIAGTASFIDNNTLEVNGKRYTADHIVISVGGEPMIPEIEGAELGITSDGFFELQSQPGNVAVIGAGYIAVELAGVLNALGSDVTMLLRGQHLLGRFDSMLRDVLMEEMVNAGVNILSCIQLQALKKEANGKITLVGANSLTLGGFDTVIWAVGRRHLTYTLNLENTDVTVEPDGTIPVDDFQNTNVPHIYAVGDITGQAALTPVAIAAGRRLGERLFNQQHDRKVDTSLVPTVVFSHPPIGTIGLSEEDARKQHGEAVKVYQTRFTSMQQTMFEHKHETAMKLVTVGAQQKVIGCHIIGPASDEMLQGFAVAMRMGATKKDFDDTIAIHPTSAEELVTMR
ncbi:MAG: glutathione-disulfide reductase [Gammaproteobacteria bacterium]|nr:glutathione-disulfide reductase [Gammaproteobacteria bacterium]